MSYYIEQDKPLTGWRRVFRFSYFPYTVYTGTPEEYPHVRVVGVADTTWGAHRRIAKYEKRLGQLAERRVVERIA